MIIGHGDDIYNYAGNIRYNFSSNVFRATALPGLKDYLRSQLAVIDHYPPAEDFTLEQQISRVLGIQPREVLLTNGATEAIYLIAQAVGAGCQSAIVVPTFSEYADACRLCGHKVAYIRSLADVNDSMNAVWLCNPNNPTGMALPPQEIVNAAINHPNTVFIIDQSYAYFCRMAALQPREAVALGNVLQLHSMTKRYAIPGLRLGFITGAQTLLQTLRDHRMPWSVNALALEAGRYIVAHLDEQTFNVNAYLAEAQRLREALNAINGITALPTQTHFMLLHIPAWDAVALKRRLVDEAGILVRAAHNFIGLDKHYIRIATQMPQENNRLVEALQTLV